MPVRDNVQPEVVADPEKAGITEQTGSSGTGTPGSSNVAGQKDSRESQRDADGREDEWSVQ